MGEREKRKTKTSLLLGSSLALNQRRIDSMITLVLLLLPRFIHHLSILGLNSFD